MAQYARLGGSTTVEDAQATLPAPTTASHGEAITGHRLPDGRAPREWEVTIDTATTSTLTDLAIWGYDGSKWRQLAIVGSTLLFSSLTVSGGIALELQDLGLYDRVAFSAATVSAAVTIAVRPLVEL